MACFRRADVVVLPYLRTDRFDFSGVLATALAFGKPLVLSDVGGFSEVAQAGAARLVPPGDAEALAERWTSLLSDPQAARAPGPRGAGGGRRALLLGRARPSSRWRSTASWRAEATGARAPAAIDPRGTIRRVWTASRVHGEEPHAHRRT